MRRATLIPGRVLAERHQQAVQTTMEILCKVFPFIVAGISIGGFIHGYAPENWLAEHAGRENWWWAVTALSLPELIILRRVLRPPLLAAFVAVLTVTIIGVGSLFNAVVT